MPWLRKSRRSESRRDRGRRGRGGHVSGMAGLLPLGAEFGLACCCSLAGSYGVEEMTQAGDPRLQVVNFDFQLARGKRLECFDQLGSGCSAHDKNHEQLTRLAEGTYLQMSPLF